MTTPKKAPQTSSMIAGPAEARLWFLGTLVTVRLSAQTNADGISLIEHCLPYGFSPPLHIHHTEDEVFHMVSGEALFTVGGKEKRAQAGETFVAPKGVPHSFIVTSPEGAVWINVTKGGDFERMVCTVGRTAERSAVVKAAVKPDPDEAAALNEACRANGIEIIGPPMTLPRVAAAAA